MMNDKPLQLSLFYCANSLDANALRQSFESGKCELTIVSLPCSGKVNLLYLLKAFEKGADAVMLVTCGDGDCKFLEGNLRAQKRADAVDALLAESGLDRGRIRVVRKTSKDGIPQVIKEINALRESIGNQQ